MDIEKNALKKKNKNNKFLLLKLGAKFKILKTCVKSKKLKVKENMCEMYFSKKNDKEKKSIKKV